MLIVGCYLSLQLDKLRSEDLSYSALNGIGALLILYSIFFKFNLSAFVIESIWVLISIVGVVRWFRRDSAAEIDRGPTDTNS